MNLYNNVITRKNNFNLVRLIAAVSVVYFHSYLMSPIAVDRLDPISRLMTPAMNLGSMAVGAFFFVSGIFVTQSWLRDPHVMRFLTRRVARIIPGLSVCVISTTIIAVSFFSKQGPFGLIDIRPWKYIFENCFVHFLKHVIPGDELRIEGVYFKYQDSDLNGPLWTLYWEGRVYILFAIIGLVSATKNRLQLALMIGAFMTVCIVEPTFIAGFYWETPFLILFCCGGILYCLSEYVSIGLPAFLGILIFSLVLQAPSREIGLYMVTCTAVLLIGGAKKQVWGFMQRNDYSFGIYIYHVPVMQMVRMKSGNLNPATFFFVVLIITIPLAVASWVWIESNALRYCSALINKKRRSCTKGQIHQSDDSPTSIL